MGLSRRVGDSRTGERPPVLRTDGTALREEPAPADLLIERERLPGYFFKLDWTK